MAWQVLCFMLFIYGILGKTLIGIGQNYESEFKSYEESVGEPVSASFYATLASASWQGDGLSFISYINSKGLYGEVGLSLKESGDCNYVYNYLNEISLGQYNNQIDTLSNVFKQYNRITWFIRIGYEVSQYLFGDCCTTPTGCNNNRYHNAFNYIANRIRNTNKVSNVKFIFHPVRSMYDASGLYPGNTHVDYIGWSIFNNDVCLTCDGVNSCPNGEQGSIDPGLQAALQWASTNTTKLFIVSESSPQPPATNSYQTFNNYLSRVYNIIGNIYKNRFYMWIYINQNWPSHGWSSQYWGNSRVQDNPNTLAYWKNITNLLS